MARVQIPQTVNELVAKARQDWPDRPYLQIRAGQSVSALTFREVAAHAETVAAALIERGVRPGDRVALLSDNRPGWIVSYFAILLTGAVVVPLDSLMAPSEISGVLEMSHACLLITTAKFTDAVRSVHGGSAGTEICSMDELVATVPPADPRSPTVLPSVRPDDPAAILFTSGTTGHSKGAVLSHRNLCSDVKAIADAGVIEPEDNFLLLLPLHHTYSSTVNMLGSMALGARATFATSFKSRDILDDIRIARITMLVGVPQVFENLMISIRRGVTGASFVRRLLFHILFGVSTACSALGLAAGRALFRSLRDRIGLGSLRLMISGGAALRPEVNRFFERLGFSLLQGYGLTETSPVLSVNLPGRNRIGTVGPPLPGVSLRIDNPDSYGIGEICAQGPMVMQAYSENPQATAEALKDGWFHTGDAGRIDRDGFLHITGRLKSVIVTGAGKNVYPEEIEARLNLSPYILDSLVLGLDRKRGTGEELTAIIVPDVTVIQTEQERGHVVDIQEEVRKVVETYNHSVPAYRRIRQWRLRNEEFEKTSMRKTKRYLYRDVFTSSSDR
jgi:long-chain acyl-CoA synthetase